MKCIELKPLEISTTENLFGGACDTNLGYDAGRLLRFIGYAFSPAGGNATIADWKITN